LVGDRDRDQAAVGPDPGIDDRQVDGPRRERFDDPRQYERPFEDVLGGDRVTNVH
jgi:hypothetical protein